MLFRNHALIAAMAVLCTMFCAMPAHAEDDGDGGVYVQHSISGSSVSTTPIRSVPLSAQVIYPAQYNGDVRDLPPVYTPPEYHTLNDFPTPMPQRALPPGGDTNAPQPPPIQYAPMPATLQNFAGLGYGTAVIGGTAGGGWPPDTNGDVGPSYYIQAVNTAFG
ncbi:MAG: hypothetical protein JSS28_04470, partial [Proteobacteria bacterium]|nr:hypothetical protein [Pseudomonadota bacterium]